VSLSEPAPDPAKSVPYESVISYQWTAPTGHRVIREDYPSTGTGVISISANGAPPLSPDALLMLISRLRESAVLDDSCNCISIEANIDSRYHRIDGSYAVQLIEGVLVKMYQHGCSARLEVADRRTVPLREVLNLFRSLTNTFDVQGIIRQNKKIEERVSRCERRGR
jgi:hypothetical protein